jgi:RNA-directed DNA polymerase
MAISDVESRDEMPKRRWSGTAGSGLGKAIDRQTVTAAKDSTSSIAATLMEEILQRDNLMKALKRVRSNKGSPGVDGMTVVDLGGFLVLDWPRIREQLLSGSYKPQPVRMIEIPKPSGGKRMLGIPTVLDRLIQQAILQVIGPLFDSTFSDASFGFRPGWSAHQAVAQACEHIAAGYRFVVDLDLEKFFDRVHHDILMSRLARVIKDRRLLRLLRRFLTAGMMSRGVVSARTEGTPQGSPLSPLLSNVLLDDLDKELERRGHRFVRYADDANVYVRSRRAGERVMASLTEFLERKLRLQVNREKSAVDRPWKRKFLGYSVTNHKQPRLKPAPESVKRMKVRVRDIMRRGRGRNIQTVIGELNLYLRGWFGYYRKSQVKQVFQLLDQWIRRHIRKLMWIRWKQPKTRWRKLRALGISAREANIATGNGRGSWWNSQSPAMQGALNKAILARWGLLSLDQQRLRYARSI